MHLTESSIKVMIVASSVLVTKSLPWLMKYVWENKMQTSHCCKTSDDQMQCFPIAYTPISILIHSQPHADRETS